MANEYRLNWLGAEVVLEGEADLRLHYLTAEVIHGGEASDAQLRHLSAEVLHVGQGSDSLLYHAVPEVVRRIANRSNLDALNDTDSADIPAIGYVDVINMVTLNDTDSDDIVNFTLNSYFPEEPDVPIEWNPYSQAVPADLAEKDPAAYDFQREQAETLREQHNITQAGDSTFPWQKMFRVSDVKEYSLGSLTRFFHPEYGLLVTRYVKFSDRWTGTTQCPVGKDVKYLGDQDWVVVDDPSRSHSSQVVGISLPAETDLASKYGWVLVQGRGVGELYIKSDTAPTPYKRFTWGSVTGFAAFEAGYNLGVILDTEWTREVLVDSASQDPKVWRLQPYSWAVDVLGVTDEYIQSQASLGLAALEDRVTAIENTPETEQVDYTATLNDLQSQINVLNTELDGEVSNRYSADQALSARITVLEDAVDLGGGATLADFYILQDRVTSIEDLQIPRIDNLETDVGTLETTVSELSAFKSDAESRLSGIETALGTYPALTDFTASVQDVVADLVVGGNLIDSTYDDVSDPRTLTIDVNSGELTEVIQDAVAALLTEGDNITLTYDDGAGTLTIAGAAGGGGGGGLSIITDTYVGDGSDPQVITLDEACEVVFIHGEGGGLDEVVQGWAFKGTSKSIRHGLSGPTSYGGPDSGQLTLAADGLSFSVSGTGTRGFNTSTTTYQYMAIPASSGGSGGGGSAATRITGTNLMFEDGDATGWDSTPTGWSIATDYDGLTPLESPYAAFKTTGGSAAAWSRTIDLSSQFTNDQLDADPKIEIHCLFGRWATDNDDMDLRIQPQNGAGTAIGSPIFLGSYSPTDVADTWIPLTVTFCLPEGTRQLELTSNVTARSGSTANVAFGGFKGWLTEEGAAASGGSDWTLHEVATAGDHFIDIPLLDGEVYEVVMRGTLPSTGRVCARVSNDGAATFLSGASDYKSQSSNSSSTMVVCNTSGAGREFITDLKLAGFNSSRRFSLVGTNMYVGNTGSLGEWVLAGYSNAAGTGDWNGIRFYEHDGSYAMDDVKIWVREVV